MEYASVSLKEHIRRVHGEKKSYSCQYCAKVYTRSANLDNHIAVEHKESKNFLVMNVKLLLFVFKIWRPIFEVFMKK